MTVSKSGRTKRQPVLVIVAGVLVFGGSVAAELLTQPRGWVRTVAFIAWCVAAFGMGMYYRDFVQRARQKRRQG